MTTARCKPQRDLHRERLNDGHREHRDDQDGRHHRHHHPPWYVAPVVAILGVFEPQIKAAIAAALDSVTGAK